MRLTWEGIQDKRIKVYFFVRLSLRKEANMDNLVQTKCSSGYISRYQPKNYVVVQLLRSCVCIVLSLPRAAANALRGVINVKVLRT